MNYGTEQNIVIQIHFSQFQKYVDMICAENNIQQHLAPPNINDGMLVGNQIRKPKTGLRCTTQCHIYPLKGGKSTNFNVLADLSTKLFTTEVRFWLKDKTLQKTSYFFFFFLKKKGRMLCSIFCHLDHLHHVIYLRISPIPGKESVRWSRMKR